MGLHNSIWHEIRYFFSEVIFPTLGDYRYQGNTDRSIDVMAALNRAIPLKHRSTFWTTVNQIISTFQSDNFNIAFNQFHAVGQIRWTACGLVRLGGCSNRTYQQLRWRFTCVTGPTCMVRYERKLTWLTYGLSKQHHSKTSKTDVSDLWSPLYHGISQPIDQLVQ